MFGFICMPLESCMLLYVGMPIPMPIPIFPFIPFDENCVDVEPLTIPPVKG